MVESESPLNILTIDGSDFQGQTSLLILSKLMETIAGELTSGAKVAGRKHLRPCDFFDVIGGVGIGGWLALLLGVFRMSIRECMNEYIKITEAIIRPDKVEEKAKTRFRRSEYDIEMLRTHINRLTKEYKIGQYCLQDQSDESPRCKRSFVVARYRDPSRPELQYCLFRTYRAEGAGDPNILYPDPEATLLSDAFAGTAAMKGCLYPFKLSSQKGAFGSDTFRGCFTNATTPALDQMSRLSTYHKRNCRVSALVNIAPPVPSPADLYKIKHHGSWASVSSKSSNSSNDSANPERDSEMLGQKSRTRFFRRKARSSSRGPNGSVSIGSENTLRPTSDGGRNGRYGRAISVDARNDSKERRKSLNWRELPVIRRSFRVQKYAEVQKSLQEDRDDHVRETEGRLRQMDPQALYVPLAPSNAPERTALNDASALPEAQSNIDEYLRRQDVQESLTRAAAHILRPYGANESST